MPSGWRVPGDGGFTPARYDILEIQGYDDKDAPQGTVLVGVLRRAEALRHGRSFEAIYLGASDEYYRYWASEGAGTGLKERATYHLCEDAVSSCTQSTVVHTDRFRTLVSSEIRRTGRLATTERNSRWRCGPPESV